MIIPKNKILPHLKDVNGVIHIGAHKKEENSFYEELGVPVVWIDAVAEEGVLPAVLHSYKGECNFYQASNGASSSVLKPKLHLIVHPRITFKDPVKVKCNTLDDEIYGNEMGYNFINIDIQGAEGHVLISAEETLKKVKYIYTEVNVAELYENCHLLSDLDEILSDFERVETVIYDQYKWGDALYVKKG